MYDNSGLYFVVGALVVAVALIAFLYFGHTGPVTGPATNTDRVTVIDRPAPAVEHDRVTIVNPPAEREDRTDLNVNIRGDQD